jgi:hypothetical protein
MAKVYTDVLLKLKKNASGENIVLFNKNNTIIFEMQEDADGYIPAIKIDYDNGDYAYEFCNPSLLNGINYVERVAKHEWHGIKYSVEDARWGSYNIECYQRGNLALVDDTSYVDATTGVEVDYATAHEDDLTQPILGEDGVIVIGYKQKMKSGYTTMVEFFLDNIYKPQIFPALRGTHRAKMGYV